MYIFLWNTPHIFDFCIINKVSSRMAKEIKTNGPDRFFITYQACCKYECDVFAGSERLQNV